MLLTKTTPARPPAGLDPALLARFTATVGKKYAITDPDAQAPYLIEMRDMFAGRTPLVLRPGSVEEVSQILRLANESATAIVPQGGNTGLVGGQTPHAGEVLLSLNRLDRVREVDPVSNTHDRRGGRHALARARSRSCRGPALSAASPLGGDLHHRRQSFHQCRGHRGARVRHCALACARPRSGARRRPRARQPQQAQEGQYRLRPQQPFHRRGRHARRDHRRGAPSHSAAALGGDGVPRRPLAAGGHSICWALPASARGAASPASN